MRAAFATFSPPSACMITRKTGGRPGTSSAMSTPFVHAVADFLDAVAGGKAVSPEFADGIDVLRVLEAGLESARSGVGSIASSDEGRRVGSCPRRNDCGWSGDDCQGKGPRPCGRSYGIDVGLAHEWNRWYDTRLRSGFSCIRRLRLFLFQHQEWLSGKTFGPATWPGEAKVPWERVRETE